MNKLQVVVEVEGGCLTDVEVLDAQGDAVDFELTINGHDQPDDEEAHWRAPAPASSQRQRRQRDQAVTEQERNRQLRHEINRAIYCLRHALAPVVGRGFCTDVDRGEIDTMIDRLKG